MTSEKVAIAASILAAHGFDLDRSELRAKIASVARQLKTIDEQGYVIVGGSKETSST